MSKKIIKQPVKISHLIQNCTICGGKPPLKKGELQDFTFEYCENCLLVKNYKKK